MDITATLPEFRDGHPLHDHHLYGLAGFALAVQRLLPLCGWGFFRPLGLPEDEMCNIVHSKSRRLTFKHLALVSRDGTPVYIPSLEDKPIEGKRLYIAARELLDSDYQRTAGIIFLWDADDQQGRRLTPILETDGASVTWLAPCLATDGCHELGRECERLRDALVQFSLHVDRRFPGQHEAGALSFQLRRLADHTVRVPTWAFVAEFRGAVASITWFCHFLGRAAKISDQELGGSLGSVAPVLDELKMPEDALVPATHLIDCASSLREALARDGKLWQRLDGVVSRNFQPESSRPYGIGRIEQRFRFSEQVDVILRVADPTNISYRQEPGDQGYQPVEPSSFSQAPEGYEFAMRVGPGLLTVAAPSNIPLSLSKR